MTGRELTEEIVDGLGCLDIIYGSNGIAPKLDRRSGVVMGNDFNAAFSTVRKVYSNTGSKHEALVEKHAFVHAIDVISGFRTKEQQQVPRRGFLRAAQRPFSTESDGLGMFIY